MKFRGKGEDCGNAKVKCDRGQPECNRCLAFGLACVYGISRKFGKPPRKRPAAHLEITSSSSHKKRAVCTARSYEHHATTREGPQNLNKDAHVGSSAPLTEFPVPSSANLQPSGLQQNQVASYLDAPFLVDDWPHLDIWGPGLDFPDLSNGSNGSNGPESGLLASAFEASSNLNASFDSPDSHSCPRGSYELFRDLICPAPFLHAPDSNLDTVSAKLDQVLHFNRDAIHRLGRLLQCPCAKSGHRVMVHASIVSRILIWYQQAAGWTSSNSLDDPPSLSAASSPPETSSLPSSLPSATPDADMTNSHMVVPSTGFAVTQVAVSMGTFTIEDENLQAVIRVQLVLSELKNIANLIESFVSRDSGESCDPGVTSLYSHIGAWLQSEHSKTIRILRAKLKFLNRTLKF